MEFTDEDEYLIVT